MKYFLLILSLFSLNSCIFRPVEIRDLDINIGDIVNMIGQNNLTFENFEVTESSIEIEFKLDIHDEIEFKECFPDFILTIDISSHSIIFYSNYYPFYPPAYFYYYIHINEKVYTDSELDLLVFNSGTYFIKMLFEVNIKNTNDVGFRIYNIPIENYRSVGFNYNIVPW